MVFGVPENWSGRYPLLRWARVGETVRKGALARPRVFYYYRIACMVTRFRRHILKNGKLSHYEKEHTSSILLQYDYTYPAFDHTRNLFPAKEYRIFAPTHKRGNLYTDKAWLLAVVEKSEA